MFKYILALDQGTTSSRTIVFNKQGEICAKAQYEYEQIYPQAGWVEHNPDSILKSQLRSLADALIDGQIEAKEIAAIGITNQRETTILWNKRTGKPVYNAIVWQCRRTAEMCEELKAEGLADYIKEHTGLIIDAYFSGTKIKWILDNVPEARELADEGNLLFGTVDTWLIWNLTGGRVHVTDYSNASRTMLFDVDKLCWDPYLCEKLNIPMSILPRVAPSSEVYGAVAQGIPGIEALAGIPICAAIGDQPAALFGQACFKPGQAKNTYGTGCFLLMNTGKTRVRSENQLVTGVAWGLGNDVVYDIEGSAFNAGSIIQWLRDELNIIENAPQCDKFAEQVPDSNGIYLVPAFTGLGAPYWDMYARACIVGMTRGTNKKHICRAVLEAITFQMTDLLEAMRADSGTDLAELRVDGGASISNIMMQIQANMIGTAVNRPKCVETTALGAAYLAGLAVGFWSGMEEIETIREVSKVFEPQITKEERDVLYSGWKRAVERAKGWVEH
ncbi:MAG: glycerol kinase GlpK [Clostridia bacterium]|nr:glycerol kinase GlpK [Clostridia bacterium]MBQ9505672.1 glycerol kinase GlpK [Clostridia bacterium]MBR5424154.1 glycerol kinase GlpK [Clostridia bacterium]